MRGNAQIESVLLGYKCNGMLSCYLYLKQECLGQGFGGYRLDSPLGDSIECGRWIRGILHAVGVTDWSDLKGKYVRVDGDDTRIKGIGHITHDKWFYPEQKEETK